MTATTAQPVPLVKAPRYATTPIWDALHAEHGPDLEAARLAALEAEAATLAAMGSTP